MTRSTPVVTAPFVVVGIGADGWDGLSDNARRELRSATNIFGSARQLDLLPGLDATVTAWTSPMSLHLADVLNAPPADTIHILASGDPMFHGVGATISTAVGRENVHVIPAVSSASLAAARLGWDLSTTTVHSLVSDPVGSLTSTLSDGLRVLVLSRDRSTPAAVAEHLCDNGFGWSSMTVLEHLGGDRERIDAGIARHWDDHTVGDDLNVIAIDCIGPARSAAPGRPDSEYDHDGQLTKATIRAVTISALRPAPGQLLWDVGGGAGSIAIEWLRTHRSCRAIVFESDARRRERIADNAVRHGVDRALTVRGEAPDAYDTAPDPDAVFIGGGLTGRGVLAGAWHALVEGGTLVANAVTIESEAVLLRWQGSVGGSVQRLRVEEPAAVGGMTAWRSGLPITQWSVSKARTPDDQRTPTPAEPT
ncbi:precorrin-6y C5,15-methyltransferase (decarboxylating) subunit CbiE [Williamsia sterculiae]|uniref:Precorrin-6Y C5,15-methyltransferase (Decarboxylating) n=1 Tax=Williamsia sterculiae TaxID=1344003 RepID=A0A1N7ENY9_9NOCA|nr:precorrin-6y C5,15-methyltransferase (decarboxylating) subunit CbiE [Williamsia sterculiae]SIR89635.1 precorrin-6Y C5,15-methyltransferase (decarboxylating) [Williamsia sterculiae]